MKHERTWNEIFDDAFHWPQLRLLGWKNFKKTPEAFHHRQKIHMWAKTAKVFKLSDDLVWAITKLSFDLDPRLLMDHALAARMPFETVVFEWNASTRTNAYKTMHIPVQDPKDPIESERPALVCCHGGHSAKVVTDLSYEDEARQLAIFPLVYYFDPEKEIERLHHPIHVMRARANLTWNSRQTTKLTGQTHFLLASPTTEKFPEQSKLVDEDDRIAVMAAGPMGWACLAIQDPLEQFKAFAAGTAGNPRWFGALCFLLNQQKTIRYVQTSQSAPINPNAKPRAVEPREADTLTLFLPKEKVVSNMLRLSTKPHKPPGEHDVIAFWSISHRYGRPDCNGGKHHWPLEFTRRQVCSECGALRWHKPPTKRGKGPAPFAKKHRQMDWGGQDINRVIEAAKPRED